MPRIGHIAIRSRDSRKAAEFFKQAFGFREIGSPKPRAPDAPPPPSVGLTDGRINLTFLTVPADNVGCAEDFFGIQHIGFIISGNRFEVIDGRDDFCCDALVFAEHFQKHFEYFDNRRIIGAAIGPFDWLRPGHDRARRLARHEHRRVRHAARRGPGRGTARTATRPCGRCAACATLPAPT